MLCCRLAESQGCTFEVAALIACKLEPFFQHNPEFIEKVQSAANALYNSRNLAATEVMPPMEIEEQSYLPGWNGNAHNDALENLKRKRDDQEDANTRKIQKLG